VEPARAFVARFDGGRLSSDGGLVVQAVHAAKSMTLCWSALT
jgi:hypothetical protein